MTRRYTVVKIRPALDLEPDFFLNGFPGDVFRVYAKGVRIFEYYISNFFWGDADDHPEIGGLVDWPSFVMGRYWRREFGQCTDVLFCRRKKGLHHVLQSLCLLEVSQWNLTFSAYRVVPSDEDGVAW